MENRSTEVNVTDTGTTGLVPSGFASATTAAAVGLLTLSTTETSFKITSKNTVGLL